MTKLLHNLETALRLASALHRYVAYRSDSFNLIHDRDTGKPIDYAKPVYKTKKGFSGYPENVVGWDGGGMAERKAAALNKAAAKAAAAEFEATPVAAVDTTPGQHYTVLLVTLEQGQPEERQLLAQLPSYGDSEDIFLAIVNGADAADVANAEHEQGEGALKAPVQRLEHLDPQGRLIRRWYFAELVEPAAWLKSPTGFVLEYWQRQALLNMALLQPNAAPEYELKALPDAELVTAAGFQPMLPRQ